MASKRIQDIVDRFVVELLTVAEEEAGDRLRDNLRDVLSVSVKDSSPAKRRRTTKGYTVLRPCPIPGCTETAAPRHQMVCKKHCEILSRDAILVARDNALKPDGIWANLKNGRRVA